MKRIIALSLWSAALYAGNITQLTNIYGVTSCSGASSASCGGSTAIASYDGNFAGTASVSASTAPFAGGSSLITDSEAQNLVVDGEGSGTLDLIFLIRGQGSEKGNNTSSEMQLVTNYGNSPFQSFQCDRWADCTWYQNQTFTLVVPVTFGQSFLFTETFRLDASAYGPGTAAYASGSIAMTGYSVFDAQGRPMEAALTDPPLDQSSVPEPGTVWYLMGAFALMWIAAKVLPAAEFHR